MYVVYLLFVDVLKALTAIKNMVAARRQWRALLPSLPITAAPTNASRSREHTPPLDSTVTHPFVPQPLSLTNRRPSLLTRTNRTRQLWKQKRSQFNSQMLLKHLHILLVRVMVWIIWGINTALLLADQGLIIKINFGEIYPIDKAIPCLLLLRHTFFNHTKAIVL